MTSFYYADTIEDATLRMWSRVDRNQTECCAQETDAMSLSRALQNNADNFSLGSEIYSLRQNALTLNDEMASKLLVMVIYSFSYRMHATAC